ncbi:flagellar basal body-associated FliL family protein [Steroidobacter agaridevorans]|uniref:flagellar basal body-associated FliL family protein n=1 Tax=Steroidobacter agaridevorans TaxID=2695856 RepID=UPI00132B7FEF|nr:flagellar basal body-associated FliL family protein [Steroidobacter agaridevorans]GFE86287.1 flagellar protein FliL [Steroidobacter agaridevorans]
MSDAPAAEAPAPAPGKSKMLVIVLCSILAAGAAGGGVYFMTAKKSGEEHAAAEAAPAVKTPAIYSKFDPPFVVNFQNKGMMRFLQVSIEVMTRDQMTADLIKEHDPKLRNDLLMLLGGQTFETLSSREGKEQLRTQALKAVADVIAAEGGKAESVEQLYFTSFVMQ